MGSISWGNKLRNVCLKMARKVFWIQRLHMKKGALHRKLRIPMGTTIPDDEMQEILRARVGTEHHIHGHNIHITKQLKKEVNLAEVLKHLHKK